MEIISWLTTVLQMGFWLNSTQSLVLCQQYIRNSEMVHRTSEIKKIELTSEI